MPLKILRWLKSKKLEKRAESKVKEESEWPLSSASEIMASAHPDARALFDRLNKMPKPVKNEVAKIVNTLVEEMATPIKEIAETSYTVLSPNLEDAVEKGTAPKDAEKFVTATHEIRSKSVILSQNLKAMIKSFEREPVTSFKFRNQLEDMREFFGDKKVVSVLFTYCKGRAQELALRGKK